MPIANRSFLHGDRKSSASSDKIIYATLDSLALKRATLPLQLLPVDDKNVTTEKATEPKKKGKICTEATAKRSSFKVRVNYSVIAISFDLLEFEKTRFEERY